MSKIRSEDSVAVVRGFDVRSFTPPKARLSDLLWVFAWLLTAAPTTAAPPPNDICGGSEIIPQTAGATEPYLTTVADLSQATDAGDPVNTCNTFVSRGIWYEFTPSVAALYTISSCPDVTGTTVSDTVMAIYTASGGCAGPFTQIPWEDGGCSDDDACAGNPAALHATLNLRLDADTTYFIVVWQWGDTAPPPGANFIQLQVTRTIPPPNDQCDSAVPLTLNTPVRGYTTGGINHYQVSSADFKGIGNTVSTAPGRDVVYAFTAPVGDAYSFKVISYDVTHDLVTYVASNCPAGPFPATVPGVIAAANRSFGLPEEVMCVPMTEGQTVYVFVDEAEPSAGLHFTVEVTSCTRESTAPNNSPTNAAPWTCGVEGSISTSGDVDFYELGTFPAGSRAFVLLDASAAGTGSDFDLRLTTATDTLEYDAADNDSSFGDLSPNLAGTSLPAEPVYLRVSGVLPSEPYRLFAVVQPSITKAVPEAEPNDTLDQANGSAANYFRGTLAGLAPTTDVDLYRFYAGDGELIYVSLDADPLRNGTPINAQLQLLDGMGNILLAVNDANQASITNTVPGILDAGTPSSPAEAFVLRVPQEGDYFVRVSIGITDNVPAGTGDYLLSIARGCSAGLPLNTPPLLANATVASPIPEGASAVVSGEIIDPDPQDPHSVVIDWGGSLIRTTNLLAAGVTAFSITNVYPDDVGTGTVSDTYPVNVTVYDNLGDSDSTNLTAIVDNVSPVVSTLVISSNPVNENDLLQLDGAFIDPGVADTHTVMIRWGDGASNVLNLALGSRSFTASHRYVDDVPTATQSDNYAITVIIADDDTGSGGSSTNLAVRNLPPTLQNLSITSPIREGAVAVLSGALSDPSPADSFALIVNWGDGTALETNSFAAGAPPFSLPHTFRDDGPSGPFSVAVTLLDDDLGLTSSSVSLNVTNAPPSLGNVSITSPIAENGTASLAGTMSDPGSLDALTLVINWGDSSPLQTNQYSAGTTSFNVPHQYRDESAGGFNTVTLSLFDNDLGVVSTTVNVTVTNVPPTFESLSVTSPIGENSTTTLAGTFADPGPLDTIKLVVDWRDGSPLQTNSYSTNHLTFSLVHQYLDDNPGGTPTDVYPVNVTLVDNDGGSTSGTRNLTVTNIPPRLNTVTLTTPIWPGDSATLQGNFADAGTLDTFSLRVDWGDGTAPQTVAYPAGASSFNFAHAYALVDTNLTVSVTLTDDDTGSDAASRSLTVRPKPAGPQFVSATRIDANTLQLRLRGTPGATYRLLVSNSLTSWAPLPGSTRVTDAEGYFQVEDAIAPPNARRFYRAVWP